MDDRQIEVILKRAFDRDWHKEALYWWEKWVKLRLLVKHLRKQNRQLRKVLYNNLKKD